MLEAQREKLLGYGDYLSIGITEDGSPINCINVPWVETVHAFNMKRPKVFISPSDLQDEELMQIILSHKVNGCYIFTPLKDYSFLSRFKDVWDLSIYGGDAITNLDFISEMSQCSMLYLENAKLENLDVIVNLKNTSNNILNNLCCLALCNCRVADLSAFETANVYFSEFLVWMPKGANEKERWSNICYGKVRYCEVDIK